MSSIALVGLYVAYRSGGQTTTTSLPGSKGGVLQLNPATTGPTSAPASPATPATGPIIIGEPQVMFSTKFAPVFKPSTFSGSKSAAVFHPSDTALQRSEATITLTTQPATVPSQPAAAAAARPAQQSAKPQ